MKKYSVATVSTNVHGNFIAWSNEVSSHDTLEAAKEAAYELEAELDAALIEREDFGNGAIRGKEVIIHDGYECFCF